MKYAALVLFALVACAGASPSPQNPRPTARAAVDVAKDAWVMVARGCLDAADISGNDTIRAECAKYLSPAHALIVAAAEAVDTNWTQGASCDLAKAAALIADTVKNVNLGPEITKEIGPTVEDAALLAGKASQWACGPDGGAS